MAAQPDFSDPDGGGSRRWLPFVIGGLLLLGVVWFVWHQLDAAHGVKVEAPPPTVVSMLPPPPPPPPPPPITRPPEPQPKSADIPNSEPPKQAPAPAAVTINGPAQAGSDAFGLQSGTGGGMGSAGTGTCTGPNCGGGGTGMGEIFYRRYVSAILQERVQRDDRLNRLVFSADFAITISPSGRITQVGILKSTGRNDRDESLKAILMSVANLDPPPSGVRFPQRVTVRGKRSL